MEVKPGYKQTEVGVIPEEWNVDSLGSIGRVIRGSSPRPKGDRRYYGGNVPRLMVEDVTRDRKYVTPTIDFLTVEGAKLSRPCKKGTLTVVCSGTPTVVGLPSILAVDACIHDGMLGLVHLSPSVEPEYLFYRLTDLQEQLHAAATHGGTFVNLTTKGFGAFTIAIPPPPEQRAIAETLSDVDGLLGGLDRLIAKKRDLKQAAMQQLLTGQTRLPGFHGDWEVNTVAELEKQKLVKLSRGQVISKKDIDNTPGDFPIYSSSIHNDGLFGRYGDFMFDEELITWSVDGGGNFFHRRKHKFSVTNVCGFMRVDTSRIDYRFFAAELQLLHSRKSFDYQSKAHPSVVRKEYEVQLPPLPEQTAIATVLSEMDGELAVVEQRREKTRALKQAMMQELLTGRTRLVPARVTEHSSQGKNPAL
jgi:type I restriction enzyme S subunit